MSAPFFFPGWQRLPGGRWATRGGRFFIVPTPGSVAFEVWEGGVPEAGGTYRADLTGWALKDAKANVRGVYEAEGRAERLASVEAAT